MMETDSVEKVTLGEMRHVGVVVRDIEKVKQFYSELFALGEWRIVDSDAPKALLHGKISPTKIRFALAKQGQVSIELIQVLEGRTAHTEFLETHGEGVHHLAYYVSDLDSELAKANRADILGCNSATVLYIEVEPFCGTGRILIPLMTNGHRAAGLDSAY